MKLLKQTRLIISIGYLLLLVTNTNAQDFSFSQFYEKPILRNPSLAGIFDGDLKVSAIFKNQWQSVTVPYQTGGFSIEDRFKVGQSSDYFTLGLQATLDQAGDIQLKEASYCQLLITINH